MPILRLAVSMFCIDIIALGVGSACGQDYPNKPVRLVAPAAGGGGDTIARMLAPGIAALLGQQVIVENRPGVTQTEMVSKSPPDGYTVLVAGGSTWIVPLLQKTPYEMKDFAPISLVERSPSVLVVHPSLPVKSVKDLIALAKAKPGDLNYGSSGAGGGIHLAVELFKSMAGVNIVHVPYKGGAAALAALMSGELQLSMNDPGVVTPHIKSGRLRALAVTTAQPSALAPGLPTVAASGVPGYEAVGMTGLFAPAKTPAAIITRLNQEVVRYLNQPEVKQKFFIAGIEVHPTTPEEFGAAVQAAITRLGKLIKDAGIKAE